MKKILVVEDDWNLNLGICHSGLDPKHPAL
jgi:hypothetical protein